MADNDDPRPLSRGLEARAALRQSLEHVAENQSSIDSGTTYDEPQRPPVRHATGSDVAQGPSARPGPSGSSSTLRRRSSSRRRSVERRKSSHGANHVRFSTEVSNRLRPSMQVNTELYTIFSRTDDAEAAARQGEEAGIGKKPLDRRPLGDEDGDGGQIQASRLTGDSERPISLTRPRRFGPGDNVKNMALAAQASATLADYRDWGRRQRERQKRWTTQPMKRLKGRIADLYRVWIFQRLLRQHPIPPSKDGRHVPLTADRANLTDERTGKAYCSNFIRSSRYTVWSFLPKQLFFQFSKLANFYFLVIGILQMIPGLSTTGTYTTIAPLIAFVAVSMAKEGWDDYRRYRMDRLENRTSVRVLDTSKRPELAKRKNTVVLEAGLVEDSEVFVAKATGDTTYWSEGETVPWTKVQWQQLRVGDIIKLKRDEDVPADLVLLHATGPNGVAYIETMALDGETNLKSKQACPLFTEHGNSISALRQCTAEVVSEDPNLDLYNYEGRAIVNHKVVPLTLNQVVYRGSTLRNTAEAIGLVINTGEECKIRMNATKNVHAKAPAMQAIVNRIVILLVFFVVLLSFGCSMGYLLWKNRSERWAYYLNRASVPFQQIFVGFVIEYNTLIPLSLYVSLEIVKIGQAILMQDIDMYDPTTDTPMVVNTTTILENLGQVSYVFSDKTGTLTQNMMKFRKLSVAGVAWLHEDVQAASEGATTVEDSVQGAVSKSLRSTTELLDYVRGHPNDAYTRAAKQFLLCLALCHTCLPERKANGQIQFQAASPDELALVEAARELGYLLIDRPTASIKLQTVDEHGNEVTESYQVLDVIEFSSKRKRMSIIIRMPDGQICIYTKGADSVILPRLKKSEMAKRTASRVERQASIRKSLEQEKALRRMSAQSPSVASPAVASAVNALSRGQSIIGKSGPARKESVQRTSIALDDWITTRELEEIAEPGSGAYVDAPVTAKQRTDSTRPMSHVEHSIDAYIAESQVLNDQAIFERCFQHVDDFASEGLRTLLYAYAYIDEAEYGKWKTVYHAASTSLVDRQARIEAAAEEIECNLDLAGATAIEDKLQQGVPETIDKLRRANIKVWMLTGDKRETAINIAHSASICKPFSELYVLDATEDGLQERVAALLIETSRGMSPHTVVVIDGHTLSVVEDDFSLKNLFFDLVARVDSVICCRASPSQKATLVKCIRDRVPKSLTLAIGDGANDIAMIQASHVGIGISGREGLQAARISDYSIAQFRFLQKLLFVHGRWNYIRTGKYILGTFWKEIVFYLVQALYQRDNGYTGTSLYESTSLAVFNTLFTSLAVILVGIFEQDLRAETLLAVPELYTYGQRNQGFNMLKYIAWMTLAVIEAMIIYFGIYFVFDASGFTNDNSLVAMGTMAFSTCVIFINIKMLLLEMHHKTLIPIIGCLITVTGWFIWNIFLASVYARTPGPYEVRDGFTKNFGRQPKWWLTLGMVLCAVVVAELCVAALRRVYWPRDEDLMQEVERYEGVRNVLRGHVGGENAVPVAGGKERKKWQWKGKGKAKEIPEEDSRGSADSYWETHTAPIFRHPFQDTSSSSDPKKANADISVTELTPSVPDMAPPIAGPSSSAGGKRQSIRNSLSKVLPSRKESASVRGQETSTVEESFELMDQRPKVSTASESS